jgi:acyl-CoA reductase-like NAD-dependent aldehyde dehydrogenase
MAELVSNTEVTEILRRVRERLGEGGTAPRPGPAPVAAGPPRTAETRPATGAAVATVSAHGDGIFPTVDAAVEAARAAFLEFREVGLTKRHAIIAAIRQAMREHGPALAHGAREESGIGRAEDKVIKNRLVTEKTPGPEDLEPQVVTGDRGMTITEYAPFGVIASITPTTNPTSTIINNTLAILSAGNTVVFNAHPNAKRISVENVRLISRAIAAAGGPANLITAIPEPTIETAREVMHHPGVRILLVTGGPAVVNEALKTDKRAITAGPGNPPVVVDETADIALAGREIVRGASFDNNLICTDEKEVFAVREAADELVRVMAKSGAYVLKEFELRKLERVIFERLGEPGKPGVINRKWIGQNAGRILAEIGVQAGDELRLVVAEVPAEHSLVWTEQMMPVLPVVRVRDVDEALDLAVRAEHGFRHTAAIYSRNVDTITRMARLMNVSIFVANAPTFAGLGEGGEGFTSYSIATPTGEGLTRPRTFSRIRRMTIAGGLRIV